MANEKRLIDAKAYRMELYDEMNYPGRSEEFMAAIDVAIADLADAPTVDAVEVVRCKNCKHRHEDSWCEYVDDDDNFYCARGERKDCAD